MEIRELEVDFDNDVLKINGENYMKRPIVVTLPGPDGWPLKKLFNHEKVNGIPEECDELIVILNKMEVKKCNKCLKQRGLQAIKKDKEPNSKIYICGKEVAKIVSRAIHDNEPINPKT